MAADPEIVAALRRTGLFSSLSDAVVRRIASSAKVVQHKAGRQITEEGGGGVGFHLLTDGTASVQVGEVRRTDLGPGDYFGEISLIDGKPRSATVVAQTELTTISLVSWTFRPLLDELPELTMGLLLTMCERLRAAERQPGSPAT